MTRARGIINASGCADPSVRVGLTHPQYLVMLALWGDSPLSVKQIGEHLKVDAATLSPLLKRLQAAGLITRSPSQHDARLLEVAFDQRRRKLRQKAERIPPAIVERLGIDIAELHALHSALLRVIAAASIAVESS